MDNGAWIPIRYRDFWDVPRIFLARQGNETYLFDCPFDEQLEDFPDAYKVYLMPEIPDEDLPVDWTPLYDRALRYLGEVPLGHVRFDATRRKFIDPTVLTGLGAHKPAPR